MWCKNVCSNWCLYHDKPLFFCFTKRAFILLVLGFGDMVYFNRHRIFDGLHKATVTSLMAVTAFSFAGIVYQVYEHFTGEVIICLFFSYISFFLELVG